MIGGEGSCGNCAGWVKEFCDVSVQREVDTIQRVQISDYAHLELVESDPTETDEQKAELREATMLEAIHLVDYRAGELSHELDSVGCTYDDEQVRGKLIARLAGIHGS